MIVQDDHLSAPLEHTPNTEAIIVHGDVCIYETENMNKAWIESDTVVEIEE